MGLYSSQAVFLSLLYFTHFELCAIIFLQNSTLEHYTSYKALDLKHTVFAMQELQKNSKGCPLNAIREKYRQEKV